MATGRAIRLALLVSELVTNAAKHSRGEEGNGVVTVQLSRTNETVASVSVSHDDVGLPADFTLERPSGFGTRMIKILAQQMGAEIFVYRQRPGTAFIVTMSLDP